MTEAEVASNSIAAVAFVVSLFSTWIAYQSMKKAERDSRHARQVAVGQLANQLAGEVDSSTAEIDAISTRAQALNAEYEDLLQRIPAARIDPRLEGIDRKLKKLRGLVDDQRKVAARLKRDIETIKNSNDPELAERKLTELAGAIREIAVLAAGEAWDVDLSAIERRMVIAEAKHGQSAPEPLPQGNAPFCQGDVLR